MTVEYCRWSGINTYRGNRCINKMVQKRKLFHIVLYMLIVFVGVVFLPPAFVHIKYFWQDTKSVLNHSRDVPDSVKILETSTSETKDENISPPILNRVITLIKAFHLRPKDVPVIYNERKPIPDVQTGVKSSGIEMVVTIPYLVSEQRLNGYNQTLEDRNARMEEYMTSLRRSLQNEYITKIHILYTPSGLKYHIVNKTYDLLGIIRQKLHFQLVKNDVLANVALEFAYRHLQNTIVMINQADCYPQSGLDLIDKETMLKYNVMYALTRHGQVEERCNMSEQYNSISCDVKRYIGSHDTYIFIPRGNIPQEALEVTNHSNNSPGIDNVLVFTFQKILKFNVLNSCEVIRMNHLHCVSSVRKNGRVRINNKYNSASAKPTSKLIPRIVAIKVT